MKNRILTIIGLVTLTLVASIQTAEAGHGVLNKIFDQTGYFNWDVKGLGMTTHPGGNQEGTSATSGSVNINLGGTPIYGVTTWHGFGPSYWNGGAETGSPNVTFNGNAIAGTNLSEAPGGEYGLGYYSEVTNHLASGNQNYEIDNVSFNGPHNGFSVTAVHEDASKTNYGQVQIFSGNDYFHTRFGGNNGPNSGVLDFIVKPVDYDRVANIALSYAGSEGCERCGPNFQPGKFAVFEDRRSYLWYYTSAGGVAPTNLVDELFATEHPDPHIAYANDGSDWDTYRFNVLLPAHTNIFALQTHSDDELWLGASASLVGVTAFIPEYTHAVPEPMTMLLFGTGLVGAALRRKFNV